MLLMAAQPSVEELLLLFFNRGNSSVGKGTGVRTAVFTREGDRGA
jgi:hypothetical protein